VGPRNHVVDMVADNPTGMGTNIDALYIVDVITHDVGLLRTVMYTLLITQLVQYRFSIKLHPKQK